MCGVPPLYTQLEKAAILFSELSITLEEREGRGGEGRGEGEGEGEEREVRLCSCGQQSYHATPGAHPCQWHGAPTPHFSSSRSLRAKEPSDFRPSSTPGRHRPSTPNRSYQEERPKRWVRLYCRLCTTLDRQTDRQTDRLCSMST